MKQVRLKLWKDRENCTRTIRKNVNAPAWTLHETMICANPEQGSDHDSALCKGDGGGPLVCQQIGTGHRCVVTRKQNYAPAKTCKFSSKVATLCRF